MVIILKQDTTESEIASLKNRLVNTGYAVHLFNSGTSTLLGIAGDTRSLDPSQLTALETVERVIPIEHPFTLASRIFHPEDTSFRVGDVLVGGDEPVVIAGPCAVETERQLLTTAYHIQQSGAKMLRGGAFKPRSSPYSFQGLKEEGLKLLAKARQETGLPVISEVVSTETAELASEYVDVLQIGTRNMQNYPLLKSVARLGKPILLKRGMAATIEELLLSAEYILAEGNSQVILCERGIRTFEPSTRSTLDISAVPVIKELSHLPVMIDPSHAAGKWQWVIPLAKAGIAVGAHGLLVEVHPNPELALSDGAQSLTIENFGKLMENLKQVWPTTKLGV